MENLLVVESIQKYYGNKENITKAINDISFNVNGGEFIGIMGASGSGKTTLLNCISTIDSVSSGHIYLENKDITKIKEEDIAKFRRENLGFIFQDFNLLDTLTVEENIALILTINKVQQKDIDNKVFKKAKLGGYDIKDVEDFLVLVMNDYEKLYKENNELRGQVQTLQQSVDHYSSLEAGIDRTVENAQTEADSIKLAAQKQAETIKSGAELDAKQRLEDLQRQIIKAEVDIETKKNQMRIYKIKVQSMLEAQLKILNEEVD